MRLNQKITLITGAAQGIGEACARLFVAEGAFVILADIQDNQGTQLAHSLGPSATYQHLDVSQEADWDKIESFITQRFGHLDVLVNNAGVMALPNHPGAQDPEHMPLDLWQQIHAINSDSVFMGCRMAIRLMKDRGGSIINMSSRSGMVGLPYASAYAASKAAVRNHTKSVALYCAQMKYNIRCNSLHPGAVLTPLWHPQLGSTHEERQFGIESLSANIPLGRMGMPEEVALAALYFASDESSYTTGSELVLDGGILAGSAAAPKQQKKI